MNKFTSTEIEYKVLGLNNAVADLNKLIFKLQPMSELHKMNEEIDELQAKQDYLITRMSRCEYKLDNPALTPREKTEIKKEIRTLTKQLRVVYTKLEEDKLEFTSSKEAVEEIIESKIGNVKQQYDFMQRQYFSIVSNRYNAYLSSLNRLAETSYDLLPTDRIVTSELKEFDFSQFVKTEESENE